MNARERYAENPFFVLGVALTATPQEVERAAQRLLAELTLGRATAKTFQSPFGARPRTEDLVRQAAAELRDPARRLAHEILAETPMPPMVEAEEPGLSWRLVAPILGLRKP